MAVIPAERPGCSVIIATLDRADSLGRVLRCLQDQTLRPSEAIIVPAGGRVGVDAVVEATPCSFPVRVVAAGTKSAAQQRNLGASGATGEILAFLDDDIEFGRDLFAAALAQFRNNGVDAPGAVSPRLATHERRPPGRLTRMYYRIQAGYRHADYGGRLFGPGINCLPVFDAAARERVRVEWLPSTCLFVRADLFRRHGFPSFTGYSYAEDVHLTARLAREAPLFFLREPAIVHHSLPSEFKHDAAALTAGKLRNMAAVAREVQGLRGWSLAWRWNLHRIFMIAVLLGRRPAGWTDQLRGVLRARS